MSRYVVIKDGTVINAIEWDGVAQWSPPKDCQAIATATANIGDSWDGAVFSAPLIEIEIEAVLVSDVLTESILSADFVPGTLTDEERDKAILSLLMRK